MNKLKPSRIIHPKQIFQRELDVRNETVHTLEAKTGIEWGIWEQVRTGAIIDDTLAHALESWWDIPAQFWLNLWETHLKRVGDRQTKLSDIINSLEA